METLQKYSKLGSETPVEAQDVEGSLHSSDTGEFYYSPPQKRSFRHIIAYGTLVLSNITLLILYIRGSYISLPTVSDVDCIRPKLSFSAPAFDGAIKYERRRLFRPLVDNPFTGSPRPELDAAYAKILEPMTTRITNEEHDHANLGTTTLALKDGSGYVGEMSVFHELHCIKRIRRHLNLDHYYPGLTGKDLERENVHADHCLEYWREAAMCRADATMATMFWRDAVPTSRAWSDHECVNWESFDKWARSRSLNMTDPSILNQTGRYDWISTPDGRTVLRENPEIEVFHP